jgi:hypothetical protein
MTSPLEEFKKTFDEAVAAERQRTKSLEAQEIDMGADELRRRLKGNMTC